MEKIFCEKLPRILKAKKMLEEKLNIKISNKGKDVYIKGKAKDEYTAKRVIDALNFGFDFKDAILIKEEDYEFDLLNIKEYAKNHNLERIRGRLIGKNGKTKKTLSHLTKCTIEIKDNFIGIIGPAEQIYNAQQALISLIKGSKQSNVYAYLEKHQLKPIWDLGLKDNYKNL